MRSSLYLPALAAVVAAQTATSTLTGEVNPTPDALDVEFFESLPDPTYTIVPGKLAQDVPYSPEEVLAAAASDIVENPLTVFPAVTNVAMNAAGEATPTIEPESRRRRGTSVVHELAKRKACDPEATISNYYGVDVSSYGSFVADPVIASVANNALPTPAGYFQNFKNAPGASRASAYLGYSVLKTGYDVAACAAKCTKKAGCVAFNIFFERDPVKTPGSDCRNPDAFANIKCSFWGVPLDTTTADNKGQYRADFHVGIAGSNAYTSFTVGGPVEGYDAPLSLDRLALNAPLRDCAGTWSYLGNRFYADQPFDPRVCATACEGITAYNAAHPPKNGRAPSKCAAFGAYLMNKTTPEGQVFITGQQCTFYTKGWGDEYAKNKGGNKDKSGNVYTFSTSYFYSNPDLQPVCSAAVEERGLGLIRGRAWRK